MMKEVRILVMLRNFLLLVASILSFFAKIQIHFSVRKVRKLFGKNFFIFFFHLNLLSFIVAANCERLKRTLSIPASIQFDRSPTHSNASLFSRSPLWLAHSFVF
jgi:hypothetical protein